MNDEYKKNMIKQGKSILLGSLKIIFIVLGLIMLEIDGLRDIIIYMLTVYCASTIKDILKFKKWIIGFIKYVIFIVILYTIAYISLGYGTIGFTLYILALSLFKIFGTKQSRNNYMSGMRNIESMLFGKSLDKNNWVDNKPKINIKK